jgi:hypothetical protein
MVHNTDIEAWRKSINDTLVRLKLSDTIALIDVRDTNLTDTIEAFTDTFEKEGITPNSLIDAFPSDEPLTLIRRDSLQNTANKSRFPAGMLLAYLLIIRRRHYALVHHWIWGKEDLQWAFSENGLSMESY